jgi:acetyl esterase/lipase
MRSVGFRSRGRERRSAVFMLLLVGAVGMESANAEVDDRFERWDRNGDGRLVRDELPEGLRGNFERVDRNGDGFIDLQEHLAVVGRDRASNPPPDGSVRVIDDIDYGRDGNPRHRLALAIPARSAIEGPLPVVVYIHGGGWRVGDHQSGLEQAMSFAATGRYAVASIGYRLSGEAIWPAQLEDCRAALRWIHDHAERLGFDRERIAVFGRSAGGHLAAMLAVRPDPPVRVRAAVDFYGPTDLLAMQVQAPEGAIDHDAVGSPESRLVGGALQSRPDRARDASPINFVDADDPPILVIHGRRDRLVSFEQSVEFAKAARRVGGRVTLVPVDAGGHGGFLDPSIDAAVRAFLEHHLHDAGEPPRGIDPTKAMTP